MQSDGQRKKEAEKKERERERDNIMNRIKLEEK